MNRMISDEKLDRFMKEGLESPPAELLHRVQAIPEKKRDYSLVVDSTRRSDTIAGFVTGIIALWVLGLTILYKDVLIQLFAGASSIGMSGTSLYYLIPFAGIVTFALIFSRYLFPSDCTRNGDPC